MKSCDICDVDDVATDLSKLRPSAESSSVMQLSLLHKIFELVLLCFHQ